MFEDTATRRLQGVFTLHAALAAWSQQLGVGLPDDVTSSVIPWVPKSPFLARMDSVVYYGFYDITQVQLSLMESIAKSYALTVFFPLTSDSSYLYARQFFEQHLLKAGVIHRQIQETDFASSLESPRERTPSVQVANAVGHRGELTFACKAIWQVVENGGQAFHRIGVVARNLDAYIPFLARVFREHHIPFWTTGTESLLQDPLAKVWWQLAGLREEQYVVSSMLDVLSAPLYDHQHTQEGLLEKNANLWRQVARHLRIIRGREDWERLSFAAQDQDVLTRWEQWSGLSSEMAQSVLQQLATLGPALIHDCEALPERGTFSHLTDAFEAMIRQHGLVAEKAPRGFLKETEEERWDTLMQGFGKALERVKELDCVEGVVPWNEWMKEFRKALESIQVPIVGQSSVGVSVLDAMSARGYAFDTLIVLGMNDQVFPRVVKEDAFLRDRERKVLAEGLGYKTQEKMKGFEEEALLFQLLIDSAQAGVYLVYQRMDQQGRSLAPSSFLGKWLACELKEGVQEIQIPLRLSEQEHTPYFGGNNETNQEYNLRSLLAGKDLIQTLGEESPWKVLLRNGLEAVGHLDRSLHRTGSYDGILSHGGVHWEELVRRGLSPSALEQYVQCPMRYWMKYGLHTRNIRERVSRHISMRVLGEIGHRILYEVYQRWGSDGRNNDMIPVSDISERLETSMRKNFDHYATRYGKGYLVVWNWMQENFRRLMLSLVEYDHQEFLETGYRPGRFEVGGEGEIPGVDGQASSLITIRGRLDRIDRNLENESLRIVDYKFSESRRAQLSDPDLVNEALRGGRLQPPLYALLSSFHSSAGEPTSEIRPLNRPSVEFRYLRPLNSQPLGVASFSASTWESPVGDQLLRTIHAWISGLQGGKFFIMPGNYCMTCDWSVACRVWHHPSWARAFGFPLAKEFRQYRKQRAIDG